MFKRQLLIIAIFGALCAGAIGYSAVNVSNSTSEFTRSGYVHTTSAESSEKRIIFDSGTTYKKKAEGTISFSDVLGDNSNIDEVNFIHYDDSSLSSFKDGVLIDLEDLSDDSAMNHYAVSAGTVLVKNGSTFSAENSTIEYSFKDFVWKIDENKYLFVSPTMDLKTTPDAETRKISNYCEVTYIGDNLIQIQTEDNYWTTISNNCHLTTADGYDINLSERNVSKGTADGKSDILLNFSRISLGSENGKEIEQLNPQLESYKETVIPHFSITAENGADGITGQAGESGEVGGPGQPGTNGSAGTSGYNGDPGGTGVSPGAEIIEGDVINFPVFTIASWNVQATSCSGSITIVDEDNLLQNDDSYDVLDGKNRSVYGLYLLDMDTGEIIYEIDSGSNAERKGAGAWKFYTYANDASHPVNFHFEGLTPEHTYTLRANALTQVDGSSDPYVRNYVSKTFWTDSVGIYMEAAAASIDSVGFNIIKRNYVDSNFKIYYRVFNTYEEANAVNVSDELTGSMNYWNPYGHDDWNFVVGEGTNANYQYWACTYPNQNYSEYSTANLTHDTARYVRLAYTFADPISGSKTKFDGVTDQILELKTLKIRPTVSSPILSQNRLAWGFDVTTGRIDDPDSGIESYTYEFYDLSQFQTDPSTGDVLDELKPNQLPRKIYVKNDGGNLTVSLDETYLKSMTTYRVRTVVRFNDNEKVYNIYTGFSNTCVMESSIRPSVYFSAIVSSTEVVNGSYVNLPWYDDAYGYIYVNPGSNGSRLMLNKNTQRLYNAPVITFRLNGYYEADYAVYDKNDTQIGYDVDPADPTQMIHTDKHILLGETLDDGRVKIYLPDVVQISGATSGTITPADCICGLQPNKIYNISVTGDLSNDGVNVIETMADVGTCQVKTASMPTVACNWTTTRGTDALQNATIKLSAAEMDQAAEFARGKETLSSVTFTLYNKELIDEQAIKTDNNRSFLKSFTLNKNVPEDKLLMDLMFTDAGLTLTTDMFNPDPTYSDYLSTNFDNMTIAISKAYDYTNNADYRQNQEPFKNIRQDDKNYTVGSNSYYINEFPLTNTVVNIVSTRDIKPITGKDWNMMQKDSGTGGIRLQAGYSNSSNTITGGSITYYVFDAVDFYAANKIQPLESKTRVNNQKDDPDFYGYHDTNGDGEVYLYNGKVYNVNHTIQDWMTYADGETPTYVGTEGSRALSYITPVHLDGLALGTVTIPVSEGQTAAPTCVFYGMTRANYATQHGGSIGSTDANGDYYLFFDDAHSDEPERGHQFVFCYTVNCHSEDAGKRYVYPFDSYVEVVQTIAGGGTNKSQAYYSTFADDSMENVKIADIPDDSIMPSATFVTQTSDYVDDNPNCRYGRDAYMLIPHTTFKKLPDADVPKLLPNCYSIQWSSNFKSSNLNSTRTDNSITMRSIVKDSDNSVFKNSYNGSSTEFRTDFYLYKDVPSGSVPQYEKFTKNSSTNVPVFTESSVTEALINQSMLGLSSSPLNIGNFTIKEGDLNTYGVALKNNREAIGMIPIQRYTNKYTDYYWTGNTDKRVHIVGNNYSVGSEDGNYTEKAYGTDKNSFKLYQELFTTRFKDIYDYHKSTGENRTADKNEIKAYYRWRVIDGETDAALFTLIGKKDLLENIVGVRIYFIGWEKGGLNSFFNGLGTDDDARRTAFTSRSTQHPWDRVFYVDKYMKSIDSFTTSDVDSSTPFVDYSTSSFKGISNAYVLNFKVSVNEELSKNLTDIDNSFTSYDFSGINETAYGPQGKVGIRIKLLYAGEDYGYDKLGSTYSKTDTISYDASNDTPESGKFIYGSGSGVNNTFGIVSEQRDVANTDYADTRLHKLSNTQYLYFDAVNKLSTASFSSYLGKFGSFLRMKLGNSGTSLDVMSTRHWVYTATSTNYRITQPFTSITSATQKMYLPFNIVESDGYIYLYDYNTHYAGATEPATGGAVLELDMPKATPSITYAGATTDFRNATVNYTFSAADPTMFFTVCEGAVNPDNAAGNNAKYFKVDLTNPSEPKLQLISGESPKQMYINSTSSEPNRADAKAAGDNIYEDYMIPVDGTSTEELFKGLNADKNYTIICWRWTLLEGTEGTDTAKYGYKRIPMEYGGSKPANYFTIVTKKLPNPTFTVSYESPSGDQKFLNTYLDLGDPAEETDVYYVYKLERKEADDSYTELSYFRSSSNFRNNEHFDVDGRGENGYNSNSYTDFEKNTLNITDNHVNPLQLIVHSNNEFSTSGLPGTGTQLQLEYGQTYRVSAYVYKNGTGPCFVPAGTYDWVNDPDDILKDELTDKRPQREFKINDIWDTTTRISNEIRVNDGSVSYITYRLGIINTQSGSIKGNYVAPVVVWKHYTVDPTITRSGGAITKTGGEWDYYDITGLVTINGKALSDSTVKGVIPCGSSAQTIRLDFSEEVDPTTSTYALRTINGVQMKEYDEIYCYEYAYQGKTLTTTGGAGNVSGPVVSNTDSICYENIIGDRMTTDQLSHHLDGSYKLNVDSGTDAGEPEIYSKLGEALNEYSRLMADASERDIEEVSVSAGTVTISVSDEMKMGVVTMRDVKSPTAIKTMTYSVKANAYREQGTTVTKKSYEINLTNKPLTWNLKKETDPFAKSIDLSSIYQAATNDSYELYEWEITLYFTSNDPGATERVVPIRPDSESDTQTLTAYDAGHKLTLHSIADLDIVIPDTTTAPAPLLYKNPLTKILHNLFDNVGGGANE